MRSLVAYIQSGIYEAYYTSLIINGLRQEVWPYVQSFHPSTVIDACDLGCIYEYSQRVKESSSLATDNDSSILVCSGLFVATCTVKASHNLHKCATGISALISSIEDPLDDPFIMDNTIDEDIRESTTSNYKSHDSDVETIVLASATDGQFNDICVESTMEIQFHSGEAASRFIVDTEPLKAPTIDNNFLILGSQSSVPHEDLVLPEILLVNGVAVISVITIADSVTIKDKGGTPLQVVYRAIHNPRTVYNEFQDRYVQTEEAKVVKLLRAVTNSGEGTAEELASISLLIRRIVAMDKPAKEE